MFEVPSPASEPKPAAGVARHAPMSGTVCTTSSFIFVLRAAASTSMIPPCEKAG